MIQTCTAEYRADAGRPDLEHCGRVFDDADRSTICPHPELGHPVLFGQPEEFPVRADAVLSDDGVYRYSLTRFWCDPGAFLQRPATFIMLNPSTADALQDDPTIQRCVKFARSWGLDGIRVVNLYAFRTSQPSVLWEALAGGVDIVGPENERTIGRALFEAKNLRTPVIAAWGNHGAAGRVEWLVSQANRWGVNLSCLGITLSGAPKHPLARGQHRIPDDAQPVPWEQR